MNDPKRVRPMRGRVVVRRVLLVTTLVVDTLLLLIAMTVAAPHAPLLGLALHPAVQGVTLYLLLAGCLSVVAGLVVRRLGGARWGKALAIAGGLASAILMIPAFAFWRAAAATGTSLSLSEHLAVRFQTGNPVESHSSTYGVFDGEEAKVDVWLPPAPTSPTAAIVWLHGGGFALGTRGKTPRWNEWLTQRGYAVFDIDYRLAPPPRWDEGAGDARCAMAWVSSNASRFNIDPTRIVLAGESAGGTLALLAAYGAAPEHPRACETAAPPAAAVIAFYPVVDLAEFWERNTVFGHSRRWSEVFTGGTPNDVAARYTFVSPLEHVGPNVPPTLLIEGIDDNVVLYKNAVALDTALASAGARHELLGLPQTDHGFDLFWGSFPTQIARHVLERFLKDSLERGNPRASR